MSSSAGLAEFLLITKAGPSVPSSPVPVTVKTVPIPVDVNVPVEPLISAPSKSALVCVILPVESAVAVVVPTTNLSADSSNMNIALSPVEPLSIKRPRSFAFEPAPEFNSNKLSETVVFVVFTVVVVPLTVKLPAIVTLSGKPTVIVPDDSETSTSLLVPANVIVPPKAVAVEFEPSDTVIDEFANLEFAIEPAIYRLQ